MGANRIGSKGLLPLLVGSLLAAGSLAANAAPANAAGPDLPATQASSNEYRPIRASEVIGMSVRNLEGDNIGQIEDLVLNVESGHVRYAVLRFDPGVLEGEELFAVPAPMLRVAADRNDVVLPIPESRLEHAAFSAERWGEDYLADVEHIRELDDAWGIAAEPGPVIRASSLIGESIVTAAGDHIGEVEELVIDAARSDVHYVVADFDPGWLSKEKRAVLPLDSFVRTGTTGHLVLDITPSEVLALREFRPAQYGSLSDQRFLADLDRQLLMASSLTAEHAAGAGASPASRP